MTKSNIGKPIIKPKTARNENVNLEMLDSATSYHQPKEFYYQSDHVDGEPIKSKEF